MGTTLSQRDVNNGHVVYIHDHSDINNDSVIYALGLIYGPQLELGIQPQNRWYFSQVVQLPVRVDQVRTFYLLIPLLFGASRMTVTGVSNVLSVLDETRRSWRFLCALKELQLRLRVRLSV